MELETIDDDTDKHGIQFVKSKDSKLATDIGIFSFPALVYYETGVPIMYDGKDFTDRESNGSVSWSTSDPEMNLSAETGHASNVSNFTQIISSDLANR